jgi:hypothetical protein
VIDAARAIRFAENDLKTELPNWVSRMQALAADALTDECAAAIAAAACKEASKGAEETAEIDLPAIIVEAQSGTGARAAACREILLCIGRMADRNQEEV